MIRDSVSQFIENPAYFEYFITHYINGKTKIWMVINHHPQELSQHNAVDAWSTQFYISIPSQSRHGVALFTNWVSNHLMVLNRHDIAYVAEVLENANYNNNNNGAQFRVESIGIGQKSTNEDWSSLSLDVTLHFCTCQHEKLIFTQTVGEIIGEMPKNNIFLLNNLPII